MYLRTCPVLAVARESFPARVFPGSILCGIGHRLNNDQRKVFVWQKVQIAEAAAAKAEQAVKAEAGEGKETVVVGRALQVTRPVAAGQTLRLVANRTVGSECNPKPAA